MTKIGGTTIKIDSTTGAMTSESLDGHSCPKKSIGYTMISTKVALLLCRLAQLIENSGPVALFDRLLAVKKLHDLIFLLKPASLLFIRKLLVNLQVYSMIVVFLSVQLVLSVVKYFTLLTKQVVRVGPKNPPDSIPTL